MAQGTINGNGTNTARIDVSNQFTGNQGIGIAPGTDVSLNVANTLTDGTTVYGIASSGTIQSVATTAANLFLSNPKTVAASFTVATLSHYAIIQGTIGSGSAVTTQIGFNAPPGMTGGTNNYGFRGGIAAASGRYNLYMDGSAANYLTGTIASLGSYTATTASAANLNIDSAGLMQRSTSSLKYKRDVEPLDNADVLFDLRPVWYRSKCEADNPSWSWYGLIAEEVAALDPRLVHWGYPTKLIKEAISFNAKVDDDGTILIPAYSGEIEREVPDYDCPLQAEGVQYDRLTVLLIDIVKRQEQRILALEKLIK